MSSVSDLTLSEDKNSVSWTYLGNNIEVDAKNIGQAIEDKVHGKIVISLCRGQYPHQVRIYELTGEQQLSFDEPKPFEFYYLKQHSKFGVSVVCVTNEPVEGRMDWQFEVDYKAGKLRRAAPSY